MTHFIAMDFTLYIQLRVCEARGLILTFQFKWIAQTTSYRHKVDSSSYMTLEKQTKY